MWGTHNCEDRSWEQGVDRSKEPATHRCAGGSKRGVKLRIINKHTSERSEGDSRAEWVGVRSVSERNGGDSRSGVNEL